MELPAFPPVILVVCFGSVICLYDPHAADTGMTSVQDGKSEFIKAI
jgi:hypothetical protein